ncbi:MAG: glycosyltransferase family 1 protein [Desulfobacteraceae bacterium]|nr:MAG: glycosyltransferase family 1 protein [Desulfobacteraceae bacterium]
MMKIAVFHNLPSGGAKRSLHEWSRYLSKNHHLDLYSYNSTQEEFLDVRSFMKNVFVYGRHLPRSTGYSLYKKARLLMELVEATKRMAQDIDSRGYDLAFVNHCAYIQSPLVLRYLKIPTVYFCQEPFRRVYEPRPWDTASASSFLKDLLIRGTDIFLKRLDQHNIKHADMVLANSNYSKEAIYRVYDKTARLNYLGVDTERFFKMDGARKKLKVLSVGRLHPSKGHDFIIRSLALLPENRRPALDIICDQADEAYLTSLKNLAAASGVGCRFLSVSAADMPLVYNEALLTLYAPVMEPLGLVALESLACGVPVVGIREAGVRETIRDGETGLLTERDPEDFAKAVLFLLEHEVIRERLGKNGIEETRKHWSWQKSSENLEEQMARLLKNNNHSHSSKLEVAGI